MTRPRLPHCASVGAARWARSDGIPIAWKDLFDIEGLATTAGSKVLASTAPAASDAATVMALKRAGMIAVGRTNMSEFAFSGLGINPHYGTPRNSHGLDVPRIPGGSSSGRSCGCRRRPRARSRWEPIRAGQSVSRPHSTASWAIQGNARPIFHGWRLSPCKEPRFARPTVPNSQGCRVDRCCDARPDLIRGVCPSAEGH